MKHVQCKNCGKWEVVDMDVDPHAALVCDCCTEDHHHGMNANMSGDPCRPISITLLAPVVVT